MIALQASTVRSVERRPTRELRNMVMALSFHAWNNTAEENERLAAAKAELKRRQRKSKRQR